METLKKFALYTASRVVYSLGYANGFAIGAFHGIKENLKSAFKK